MKKKVISDNAKRKHETEIAKWLSALREEKGISQEFLGTQLGKGQSDIAKIENGSKKVTVLELISWMAALDVPFDSIDSMLRPIYMEIRNKSDLWKHG